MASMASALSLGSQRSSAHDSWAGLAGSSPHRQAETMHGHGIRFPDRPPIVGKRGPLPASVSRHTRSYALTGYRPDRRPPYTLAPAPREPQSPAAASILLLQMIGFGLETNKSRSRSTAAAQVTPACLPQRGVRCRGARGGQISRIPSCYTMRVTLSEGPIGRCLPIKRAAWSSNTAGSSLGGAEGIRPPWPVQPTLNKCRS